MSRILIVDDHPVIRMAMKMLLEAEGHQIVGDTDNGVDAISLGRELKPDLVILDIGIPRLDGLEVISRLMVLALPLKILVLTGQSASLFALRSMQAGAAGFVCKQGGLAELVTAVNAVASGYSYFPSSAMRPVQQGAYSDDGNCSDACPIAKYRYCNTSARVIRTSRYPSRCLSATRPSALTRRACC